jgi:TPR repeat protein
MITEGLQQLKDSATKGGVQAMFKLAWRLEADDPKEAEVWCRKAADAGDPSAMYNLGLMLTEKNIVEQRRLFRLAAANGHSGAMYSLGVLSHYSSPTEAERWYEKAAQRSADRGETKRDGKVEGPGTSSGLRIAMPRPPLTCCSSLGQR